MPPIVLFNHFMRNLADTVGEELPERLSAGHADDFGPVAHSVPQQPGGGEQRERDGARRQRLLRPRMPGTDRERRRRAEPFGEAVHGIVGGGRRRPDGHEHDVVAGTAARRME